MSITPDSPLRIPSAEPTLAGNELRYVTECIETNWISSLGPYVLQFERDFAAVCGCKHGVTTSNGTTALHLALAALDIGPGDEVIVPTLTFAATANAVLYTGATPVFVDVNAQDWTVDPDAVAAAITTKTRAIIPVHLFGIPADMAAIGEVVGRRSIAVIEDAAEAHGARYGDRTVGQFGVIGCFSFYGNKILTTGEGGMCTTNDDALAERMSRLRDHGMAPERKYWHDTVGFNYRLTNLQAAIGVAQLEQMPRFLNQREQIRAWYEAALSAIPGVSWPCARADSRPVLWMFPLRLPVSDDGRDAVIADLRQQGIDVRPVFFPVHIMPPYASGQDLPRAQEIASSSIILPTFSHMTQAQVGRVAEALADAVERVR